MLRIALAVGFLLLVLNAVQPRDANAHTLSMFRAKNEARGYAAGATMRAGGQYFRLTGCKRGGKHSVTCGFAVKKYPGTVICDGRVKVFYTDTSINTDVKVLRDSC